MATVPTGQRANLISIVVPPKNVDLVVSDALSPGPGKSSCFGATLAHCLPRGKVSNCMLRAQREQDQFCMARTKRGACVDSPCDAERRLGALSREIERLVNAIAKGMPTLPWWAAIGANRGRSPRPHRPDGRTAGVLEDGL